MKPSEKNNIEIKFTKFIPFGNYFAMMWKGDVLIKNKDKDKWNNIKDSINGKEYINHEKIHLKQAVSTNDSWFVYYLKYCIKYIKNLPIIYSFDFPYKFISFEMEAYANEDKLDYLNGKEKTEEWKKYDKISLKDKRKYWKLYKEIRKEKIIGFGDFINEFIKI